MFKNKMKAADDRENMVTDLINALPGNSSVNTFQRAAMEAVSQ
jgi:hypothetical protein